MTTTTSAAPLRRTGGVSRFVGDPSFALPPSSSAPSSLCLLPPPRMAARAQACPTAASNALRAVLHGTMSVERETESAGHRRGSPREGLKRRCLASRPHHCVEGSKFRVSTDHGLPFMGLTVFAALCLELSVYCFVIVLQDWELRALTLLPRLRDFVLFGFVLSQIVSSF